MKTTELHSSEFLSLPDLETHTETVPQATYPPAGLITLSHNLGLLNRTPVATLMKVLRKTITKRLRVKLSAGGWFLILFGLYLVSSTVYADNLVSSREQNNLLQFTAGGHVLGFNSNQMYLATGSHVLSTEFVGTAGVIPQTTEVTKTSSKTLPLTKVTYPSLWQGITLVYEQTPSGVVKSTYTVAPFAQVNNIKLRYNVPVKVMADGGLRFDFETGYLNESPPIAWQDIGEKKVPVSVAFQQKDTHEAGFTASSYDPSYPLIIDPAITWNTFMGGTGGDTGFAIAVDGSGNVYVAGNSPAPSWGSPVNAHSGGTNVFVVKLNSSGVRQWNTFMGANSAFAIAVDGGENVYVVGGSNATWGSPVNAFAGSIDAFVTKLNSSGVRQWHTFMGSSGTDYGYGIAVDGSGNVYVAGKSPITWGSPVNAFAGSTDAFAAKLNSSGALQWNTFMGSALGSDISRAIAVDGSGNVYVAGYSNATWGSPVNPYTTGDDAFVAKLNSSGVRQWNTFMGGGPTDQGFGIAVDGSGNVYVTGGSNATWGSSPVNAYSALQDVFAAKLNNSGTLLWNTFMGGTGNDTYGLTIAVAGSGNIYVTGSSPATWGSPIKAYSGGSDAFAAKLNNSGVRQWNTFVGGTGSDSSYAIAVDGSGNVYVAGFSSATWGTPVNVFAGVASDAFAVKISDNPPIASDGSFATHENTALSNTLIASDLDVDPLTYSIVANGTIGTATITNASTGAFTYTPNANQKGTDTFTFKANDGILDSNIATITIMVSVPIANNGNFTTLENTALSNLLTASDVDGEPLIYSIVANGTKGTATITNASTGAFTYVPNANQTGTDTFTFKVNDGILDSNIATITITITSATPPSPPPLPDQLGLFLQLDGTGKGKVTSDTGLSCQSSDCQRALDGSLTCNPKTCKQAVKTYSTVTLTPQADMGSTFSSWGGHLDCVTGQFIMDSGKLCIAFFHLLDEPLTITVQGQGHVTDNNLHCSDNCVVNYLYGTAVTLLASPATDWLFQAWSGDCNSTGQVLMTSPKTCGATFIPDPATVDDDLDHTTTVVEDAAPNHGDGNGDGILDSLQTNVSSFVDLVSGQYLTLQVDKACPITNVYSDFPEHYPNVDRNHHFPQGLTYFELSCAKTQVTVYYHRVSKLYSNLRFYKYGPTVPGDLKTVGWYKYPATFAVVQIGGRPVMTTTYTLTDGQLGDSTGVDGRIVDPGGIELE